MDPWQDAREILALVQDEKNWTPELFKRCRENTLVSPCVHNQIRKVLTAEQYQRFDDAYCFSGRPEQKRIVEAIRKENAQKEGEKRWSAITRHSLHQSSDKQLLILLNQLRDENLV